jgi:hypothetical protein
MNLNEAYIEFLSEKFMSTVKSLTKGSRKYAKYKSALKSNRHSNKYIFTEVDDEPAIGITSMKRKGRKKEEIIDDEEMELDESNANIEISPYSSLIYDDQRKLNEAAPKGVPLHNGEKIPHFTLWDYSEFTDEDKD